MNSVQMHDHAPVGRINGHLVHVQFQAQLLPQEIPHQGNHFPEPGFTSGHHGGYFQLGHTAKKMRSALAKLWPTARAQPDSFILL